MPDAGVVHAGGKSRLSLLLLEGCDLAGVHVQRSLGLTVVELGAPDLGLGSEGVHEVLRPVHVVS